MIYVNRAFYDSIDGRFKFGQPVMLNLDHVVSISPTYMGFGQNVLMVESGMGAIYDVETLVNNAGYALKLTGVQLDKLFEEGLENLVAAKKTYKGFQNE